MSQSSHTPHHTALRQPGSKAVGIGRSDSSFSRQHFLNFLPLPHGHGSLRPTFRHGFTSPPPAFHGHGEAASSASSSSSSASSSAASYHVDSSSMPPVNGAISFSTNNAILPGSSSVRCSAASNSASPVLLSGKALSNTSRTSG